jgi:hypothetical protein
LCSVLPLALLVLPGLLGGDGKLDDGCAVRQILDQQWDIFPSFSQGRNLNRKDVEPVK